MYVVYLKTPSLFRLMNFSWILLLMKVAKSNLMAGGSPGINMDVIARIVS